MNNYKKKINEKTKREPIDKKALLKSDVLKQTSILDYFENKKKPEKIFINDKVKKKK